MHENRRLGTVLIHSATEISLIFVRKTMMVIATERLRWPNLFTERRLALWALLRMYADLTQS